jgi:hypothetical protein
MPVCFVVMGYGEKTDFATGRKLNLDKTYQNIIKPAVEQAGYKCVRADEILHSGVIDIPMYDMLLEADLVVADLSASNLNAMFELGVRHALRPRSTVVIAESKFTNPFDVNHIVIRRYTHLETDIGFDEVMRMRKELGELLAAIGKNTRPDSPVYSSIQNLQAPTKKTSQGSTGKARKASANMAASIAEARATDSTESYAALWKDAMAAKDQGDWSKARAILLDIYQAQTKSATGDAAKIPDTRIVQELALATYKAAEKAAEVGGPEVSVQGYSDAVALLEQLDPETTNDPETLGLWSAVHKRRSQLPTRSAAEQLADLDAAISAAERGFLIRQDYYTGGNLAFLLDLRASKSTGDDRIADRTLAKRVRRKVLQITQSRLETLNKTLAEAVDEASETLKDEAFWVRATHAEALVGLEEPGADQFVESLADHAEKDWMLASAKTQIARVRELHATPKQSSNQMRLTRGRRK